jgi:arsenate reductase (thioredoxin)
VLFVCVHNSGRSVMAETFVNGLAAARGLRVHAQSAGIHPGTGVNPVVAEAMREIGYNVTGHQPQLLTEEMVGGSDYIFTMGCAVDTGSCPSFFLKDVEDWALEDPHGKPLTEVRVIRNTVRRRVEDLLDRLATLAALPTEGGAAPTGETR